MKKKIAATSFVKDVEILLTGQIEVLKREKNSVYATWITFDKNGTNFASVSRNYFMKNDDYTDDDVIKAVLENITKYRVGRRRLFSQVEILD